MEKQVDQLRNELKDCRERKKRADILLRSLASEKQKWVVCLRMLNSKVKNVVGDVVLAAAYITFLSGFSKRYRSKLLEQWIEHLLKSNFYVSSPSNYSLVELFVDQVKITEWN